MKPPTPKELLAAILADRTSWETYCANLSDEELEEFDDLIGDVFELIVSEQNRRSEPE